MTPDSESVSIVRERVAALEATVEAHDKALVAAKMELDRRLGEMNQFREQISQERAKFLAREMYDREHALLSDRVTELEKSRAGALGTIGAYGSIITFVLAVAALVFAYLKH